MLQVFYLDVAYVCNVFSSVSPACFKRSICLYFNVANVASRYFKSNPVKLENFLTKSGKSEEKLEEERWGVPALKNGGSMNNRNTLHRSIHISMN
jgi:hypothetical protein